MLCKNCGVLLLLNHFHRTCIGSAVVVLKCCGCVVRVLVTYSLSFADKVVLLHSGCSFCASLDGRLAMPYKMKTFAIFCPNQERIHNNYQLGLVHVRRQGGAHNSVLVMTWVMQSHARSPFRTLHITILKWMWLHVIYSDALWLLNFSGFSRKWPVHMFLSKVRMCLKKRPQRRFGLFGKQGYRCHSQHC